jgi:hypothetical protein
MTDDEFVALVGGSIWHITATENLAGIMAHGLKRPSTLLREARGSEELLILRRDRVQFTVNGRTARLNNQEALRAGIKSAAKFLDGHTMETWSAQLDGRIFFWSKKKGLAFEGSHGDLPTTKLEIDARRFIRELAPHVDLAPINTGSAKRKPTRRGDWIYVPATKSVQEFRRNRIHMGETKTPDDVGEISVRADIPAATLKGLLVQ